MAPAELWALWEGLSRRRNSELRTLTWVMSTLPLIVARGVALGVNAAFSKEGMDTEQLEAITAECLLEAIPGFDPSVEADGAEG